MRSHLLAVLAPESDALGGIHDLAGDVWEWTSGADGQKGHVIKGGDWHTPSSELVRAAGRNVAEASFRGPNAGLRCVQ